MEQGSASRRSSDAGRSGYVHFTHHGIPAGGIGTAASSARNSMYEYPATSTNMSGYAAAPSGIGGAPSLFPPGAWPGGMRRYSLMPTKGKDWARSKKDMRWDPKFCGPEKKVRRLLMVEYCKTEVTDGGRRFIKMDAKAQECSDIAGIESLCKMERGEDVILRVFHVQNFPEAVEFLVAKYRMHDKKNIEGWDDLKEWVYHFRPTRRAGKAVPMAKTFKKRQMPGLAKVAWGMDCLKVMRVGYRPDDKKERHPDTKIAELKGFLEDGEDAEDDSRGLFRPEDPWAEEDDERSPSPHWIETDPNNPRLAHHTHDIYSQRLSVYLQWVTHDAPKPRPVPSDDTRRKAVDIFDPGSTVIVFDNSESLSIEDTVVPAHGEIERIWRGPGTSYYELVTDEEGQEVLQGSNAGNSKFARDFMQRIIETIYNSVADCWEAVLDVAWDHESILQDSIYEHPADESRASELFKNSETWLKFSKLMSYHVECIGDVQEYVGDFRDEDESNDSDTAVFTWLRSVEQTFLRLNGYIEDDLIKQTDKLTDLMYKTVGIRDSQDSLRLGTSMWRLSWVTFVFLPLSFITSFFGMNVDLFEDNPSIKWYFISATPFMTVVLISVFILKWFIDRHRRPIYERGVYERLFNELQQSNADLWSSQGPREVRPIGIGSHIKWYILYKFSKGKTSFKGTNVDYDSIWSRFKLFLIRRWSPDIVFRSPESDWIVEKETGNVMRGRRNSLQRPGVVKPASARSPAIGPGRAPLGEGRPHAHSVTPSQHSLGTAPSTSRAPRFVEKSEPFEYMGASPGAEAAPGPQVAVERPSTSQSNRSKASA
ncbi:hypothetical protein H072_120 [Dactylellina haptotyla CBS 200.50]|uniref:Uncharacterized protein n=1 Tax=Dactylellina haptotyla (strain CBS 200.50) TaxID=1284197 RepID=S8AS58_DACHA|nr:hypothetical protein H072_120 [Dactylellina haptotyla CBS 200.50]